ncbi:hypothetical protein AKJ61_00795 [candidate division MSBL1 archaeon SCGC-AAA259B11]|uniref:Uncharacterized protein n=1 Tax=candidate division MSBL1 archaeon SCGC-AAA259B11 TaxID=1698260 RepID=A0A133U844_9EURY|nr:hypothetical protein AKJ61_00795 [candidate division MSBL1 archaeon SCGC-AAA259B11]
MIELSDCPKCGAEMKHIETGEEVCPNCGFEPGDYIPRDVDRDCKEADANLFSEGIVLSPNQRNGR